MEQGQAGGTEGQGKDRVVSIVSEALGTATNIVKQKTRATIAYGLVFAFVVAALWQVMKVGDCSVAGDVKELALIAISFYFGTKNGEASGGA